MHLFIILGHELTDRTIERKNSLFSESIMAGVQPAMSCNRCTHCFNGYRNLCENKVSMSYAVDGGFAKFVGNTTAIFGPFMATFLGTNYGWISSMSFLAVGPFISIVACIILLKILKGV